VHLNATALGAPRVYQAQVAVVFTFKSGLFFDRLARIVRIILAGPRHATVTDIRDEIVHIYVPGVRWAPSPANMSTYISQHFKNPARGRTIRSQYCRLPCLRPYAAVNRSGLCCVKVKLVDPHDVMDSSCCIYVISEPVCVHNTAYFQITR
jgi:hypothetical protein